MIVFFARYSDFPVSKGHCEIVAKTHVVSFFDLDKAELEKCYALIGEAKNIIDKEFHPDGYNIGINEGRAAGRSIDHLYLHLIPKYTGDVENPRGGVRNILNNGDYSKELQKIPARLKYLNDK